MKKLLIILFIVLGLMDCRQKKKESFPLILWNSALSGDLAGLLDANGNGLPTFEDEPVQSVATKGLLSLSARVESQNCYRDELPISCDEEQFDYSTVQYQLVNSLNKEIAVGNLNPDGTISLRDTIENGNYRLLLVDNPDLNWDHYDFKYTYDPTKENKEHIILKPKRKYYFGGKAEISGVVFGDGYVTINGTTLWPSSPLENVKLEMKCKDSESFQTTTDKDGKFLFQKNLKNGPCKIFADGTELSLFNAPYGKGEKNFRFTFIGKNEMIPTIFDVGKISLPWHPADNGIASIKWKLRNFYEGDLSGFKVSLFDNDGIKIDSTETDANGTFAFSANLYKGDYFITITKDKFIDNSIALSFEPMWDGSVMDIAQTKIPEMIAKPSVITVPNNYQVTLIPKNTFMELQKTNSVLDSNWNQSQMNPVTLIPNNGSISIPPGKWDYYYSVPGYKNSDIYSLVSNGNLIALKENVNLVPSIYRSEVSGNIKLGTINNSNGVYIALFGLRNNNGEEIVLISKTVNGEFSFSENFVAVTKNSYCSTYPNCPNLSYVSLYGNDITQSIYFFNNKLFIPEGNYSWNIIDPIGTYNGNGTFVISSNSDWGSKDLISININPPIRNTVSGILSDTFSMSALNGASITFGSGTPWNPLLIEGTPITDRSNTSQLQPVTVTTNANGGWSANGLPSGTWIIKISKDGYDPIYQTVTIPQSSPVTSSLVASGGKGNLSGRIVLPGGFVFRDTFTLELTSAMSGARPSNPQPIELKSGTTSFSNTTSYKLYNINSGLWKMIFKSANYETIICWVNIGPGENNYDVLTAVQGGQPPFPISGNLYNAINNRGITVPLTLTLRPGVGNTTGTIATKADGTPYPILTSAADSTFFLPDVPAGVYTLSITGDNWAPINTTVVASAGIDRYSLFISPVLPNDEIRIVLSWNDLPKDLDSHLEYGSSTCLDMGAPCQVLWNRTSRLGGHLTLDVDVTTGFGPETITGRGSLWTQSRRGYTVYNWSNEKTLNNSGAIVRLFKNNSSRSWSVPTNIINLWWNVFCLDSNGVPQEIGTTGCLNNSFWNIAQ